MTQSVIPAVSNEMIIALPRGAVSWSAVFNCGIA